MLADWSLTLKNLFLPNFCKQCGVRLFTEENGYFCPTCWELSPRIERPFCTICGHPHRGVLGLGSTINFLCADCAARPVARPYRFIRGAARYADAVETAVKLMKFHDKPRIAYILSELMVETARVELEVESYDVLVPVPLHRIRLRERGFNQSALLAELLLPIFPNAKLSASLRRIRPTRVQSKLRTEAERRRNVHRAFQVEGEDLIGCRILLVDDVITTGGTVIECAQALKTGGAAQVDIFAAALAVHTEPRVSARRA